MRLTEYNFKTPTAAQEVDRLGDAAHPKGNVESFDWPGDYLDQAQGKGVVGRRTLAERGQAPRHRAEGDVAGLAAGVCVTVTGDDVPEVTGRCFVCLSATHTFRSQAYGSGDAQGDERAYDGSYILIPDDAPLVPERRTPAPRVHGPETAVVVGEGEIDCAEHGGILCRFHWDLDGAHTMRCRVSQNWASKGWGGMVIPRIGMEVIVEHLRGDPDIPIVTGCVYNGANRPPYELPANKTKSVFRTDTHQGAGFNELSFEDENGREEILVRANRDLTTKVDQHSTKRVDHHDLLSIGGFQLVEVEKSRTLNVGASYSISVGTGPGGDFVGGDHRNDTFGIRPAAYNISLTPDAGAAGSYSVSASGPIRLDTDAAYSVDVEGASRERVGKTKVVNVGKDHRLAVSGNSKETVGKRKVIDAHEEILIRVGRASLLMKADGTIELNGKRFDVNQADAMKVRAGKIELN